MTEEKYYLSNQAIHDVGVSINGQPTTTIPEPELIEQLVPKIKAALTRNWPEVEKVKAHGGEISIIAPGPNLADAFYDYPHQRIICVNTAHDWLLEQGIVPDICMFLDDNPEMFRIIKEPHPDVLYYCASTTGATLLDKLEGYNTFMWHPRLGYGEEKAFNRPVTFIGGGNNVGQRAISMAHFLGYRKIECFGLCGCILDGRGYINANVLATNKAISQFNSKDVHKLIYRGKSFLGLLEHAHQAGSFAKVLQFHKDCAITVHGRGLIPEIARDFWNERRDKLLEQGHTTSSSD